MTTLWSASEAMDSSELSRYWQVSALVQVTTWSTDMYNHATNIASAVVRRLCHIIMCELRVSWIWIYLPCWCAWPTTSGLATPLLYPALQRGIKEHRVYYFMRRMLVLLGLRMSFITTIAFIPSIFTTLMIEKIISYYVPDVTSMPPIPIWR